MNTDLYSIIKGKTDANLNKVYTIYLCNNSLSKKNQEKLQIDYDFFEYEFNRYKMLYEQFASYTGMFNSKNNSLQNCEDYFFLEGNTNDFLDKNIINDARMLCNLPKDIPDEVIQLGFQLFIVDYCRSGYNEEVLPYCLFSLLATHLDHLVAVTKMYLNYLHDENRIDLIETYYANKEKGYSKKFFSHTYRNAAISFHFSNDLFWKPIAIPSQNKEGTNHALKGIFCTLFERVFRLCARKTFSIEWVDKTTIRILAENRQNEICDLPILFYGKNVSKLPKKKKIPLTTQYKMMVAAIEGKEYKELGLINNKRRSLYYEHNLRERNLAFRTQMIYRRILLCRLELKCNISEKAINNILDDETIERLYFNLLRVKKGGLTKTEIAHLCEMTNIPKMKKLRNPKYLMVKYDFNSCALAFRAFCEDSERFACFLLYSHGIRIYNTDKSLDQKIMEHLNTIILSFFVKVMLKCPQKRLTVEKLKILINNTGNSSTSTTNQGDEGSSSTSKKDVDNILDEHWLNHINSCIEDPVGFIKSSALPPLSKDSYYKSFYDVSRIIWTGINAVSDSVITTLKSNISYLEE